MALSQSAAARPGSLVPRLRMAGVVAGAVTGNFFSLTQTVMNVFGVVLITLSHEFHWSRAEAAGAFTAMSLSNAAMLPIAGRLADRYGVRRVLLVGFALFGLSILLLSRAPAQPIVFYGLFVLVGMTGSIPSNLLFAKLLSQWFDKTRGLWLGVSDGVGNGLGAIVIPGVSVLLLNAFGWRGAFVGAAGMVLLIGLPVAWLTLHSPTHRLDIGEGDAPGETFKRAVRRPVFWCVIATCVIGGGVLTGVFTNTMPILIDRGLTMVQATAVIAIFSSVCVLLEPLVGFVLDRVDRPRVIAPLFLVTGAGVVVLAYGHQIAVLTLGAVMTGVGFGSMFGALPLLLSRYFGLRSMGAITGVAYATVGASISFVPLGLNYVFDITGSYTLGLDAVAAMLSGSAIVIFLMQRYPKSWEA